MFEKFLAFSLSGRFTLTWWFPRPRSMPANRSKFGEHKQTTMTFLISQIIHEHCKTFENLRYVAAWFGWNMPETWNPHLPLPLFRDAQHFSKDFIVKWFLRLFN